MSTAPKTDPRAARSEASISLRLSTPLLDLITRASIAAGKSRTEFMLESARQDAINVLLDQRFFALDDDRYEAFLNVLDNPPPPNEQLKRLLSEKAPWEA